MNLANHGLTNEFMEWKTRQLTLEGLPLFLRYPEGIDIDLYRSKFPKLLVVTHEFSKVKPNGLPDPDYNDALMQFDKDIRQAFEGAGTGLTVLIETFGGKRKYYIYAEESVTGSEALSSLSRSSPHERLSCSVHRDETWSFLAGYSKEFLS
jgi:hypothetical protein